MANGARPPSWAGEPLRKRHLSGEIVESAAPAPYPASAPHDGRYARLEPLEPASHADELYEASHGDEEGRRLWTYLPYGPFSDRAVFRAWLEEQAASSDPLFFAVRDVRSGRAGGMASFLNIRPQHRSIEIGHIWFGSSLQRTRTATEALFLLLSHALDDLGYRRMEWKCNALNESSRRAAVRLGFVFEGVFYQHLIVKGRNRDTAWYSILDHEWPTIRADFEAWLAPENFDGDGRQIRSLGEMNRAVIGP